MIHEDQHLENAASLAVIRAFRDMYNYIPPEQDIKEQSTADSRKLDLLYRGIRALFSVGLASKAKAAKPATPPKRPAVKKPAVRRPRPAVPAARKKKAAARRQTPPSRGRKK